MNALYSKDFTEYDQIAVEREFEREMDDYAMLLEHVKFDRNLNMDNHHPWRLSIQNYDGEKLMDLRIRIPGHTPKDVVLEMVRSGRFDRYIPEDVSDNGEWDWRIEKW